MVLTKPSLLIVDDEASISTAKQSVTPTSVASPSVEPPLHRGIVLVEPDTSLLSAAALLLNASNYCVRPASSPKALITLRDTKPVALAIISDSLGRHTLIDVASLVRRQWPLSRILVLGQAAALLDDYLYDEQVERPSDPTQLLETLERLYKDSWNQRSNTIDWKGAARVHGLPRLESDPTKAPAVGVTRTFGVRVLASGGDRARG